MTTSNNIQEYIKHLSLVSQPAFQEELFSLILYNMHMKQEMVRSAVWKVRKNATATSLAQELMQEELDAAISAKVHRTLHQSTSTGTEFLSAVNAVARSVAHSNEAAKRACHDAEAHQHHFGMPSIFITVSPDDDNCFLIQVLQGMIIDKGEDIGMLSNDELATHAKQRTAL